MRLLDTRMLESTDFYGKNILHCAILSHTWSEDKLITLRGLLMVCKKPSDIEAAGRRVLEKEGYLKVKAAADRACEEQTEHD